MLTILSNTVGFDLMFGSDGVIWSSI